MSLDDLAGLTPYELMNIERAAIHAWEGDTGDAEVARFCAGYHNLSDEYPDLTRSTRNSVFIVPVRSDGIDAPHNESALD